ncbi:hypothetical protein O181_004613 [Austropuccinia psidii MF-1]|uniref:Uncharacterized protein n=1 Tax=Austropuccinia psidii MF-1 TaxID=1389203 RepID=A0A9Q3BGP8_9BASI|nr:hypothetical protein [Austropuccinia psidii MF-1]
MTPTRSWSSYFIQSNGAGPGHHIINPKDKNARTSTSSQKLAGAFSTLIESPEAEITFFPAVRSKQLPGSSSGDIPVSVQELVYGGKAEGVGSASQLVDRNSELFFQSKEILGFKKDTKNSGRLDTNILERTSPKDKILAEKPKHVIRGSEEGAVPKGI